MSLPMKVLSLVEATRGILKRQINWAVYTNLILDFYVSKHHRRQRVFYEVTALEFLLVIVYCHSLLLIVFTLCNNGNSCHRRTVGN